MHERNRETRAAIRVIYELSRTARTVKDWTLLANATRLLCPRRRDRAVDALVRSLMEPEPRGKFEYLARDGADVGYSRRTNGNVAMTQPRRIAHGDAEPRVIRIAALLCKNRHSMKVKAYEPGATVERVDAQLREESPHACPTCASRIFLLEHSETSFASLTEAALHVAKLNGVVRKALN